VPRPPQNRTTFIFPPWRPRLRSMERRCGTLRRAKDWPASPSPLLGPLQRCLRWCHRRRPEG